MANPSRETWRDRSPCPIPPAWLRRSGTQPRSCGGGLGLCVGRVGEAPYGASHRGCGHRYCPGSSHPSGGSDSEHRASCASDRGDARCLARSGDVYPWSESCAGCSSVGEHSGGAGCHTLAAQCGHSGDYQCAICRYHSSAGGSQRPRYPQWSTSGRHAESRWCSASERRTAGSVCRDPGTQPGSGDCSGCAGSSGSGRHPG